MEASNTKPSRSESCTDEPYWDDIASALEYALTSPSCGPVPVGLRPMILQAIIELRALKPNPALVSALQKVGLDSFGPVTAHIQCMACRRAAAGKSFAWDTPHTCAG